MRNLPISTFLKSRRFVAGVLAVTFAFGAPAAYAATTSPTLTLMETDAGGVVASGKNFPESSTVEVEASLNGTSGDSTVKSTASGRFLVALDIVEDATGALKVTATSGEVSKTSTLNLGSSSSSSSTKTSGTKVASGKSGKKFSGTNRSGLPFQLGVFAHSKDRVAKFEEVTNRKLDVLSVSPARENGWNSVMDSWWMDTAPSGFTGGLDVSVPLWPKDGDVGTAASGGYNDQWKKLADLIASKYPNSYVRPGWEFNLKGWPWAANEGNSSQWIKAFQQASTSMKQAQPSLKIEWNVNAGTGDGLADATKVWPGDEYVDVVGLDSYDWDPGDKSDGDWDKHLNGAGGYNYWMKFARDHGKTFSLPEWGVTTAEGSNRGGDNPRYINHVFGWLAENADNVAHVDYFDEPEAYIKSSLAQGQAPQALAAFKARTAEIASGGGVSSKSSTSSADDEGTDSSSAASATASASASVGASASSSVGDSNDDAKEESGDGKDSDEKKSDDKKSDDKKSDSSGDDKKSGGGATSYGDASGGHGPVPV